MYVILTADVALAVFGHEQKREALWASLFEFGAGEESRTLDLNLGKVALYQLSYSRVRQKRDYKGSRIFVKQHYRFVNGYLASLVSLAMRDAGNTPWTIGSALRLLRAAAAL